MSLVNVIIGIFVVMTAVGIWMNVGHDWLRSKRYSHRVILKPLAYRSGLDFDRLRTDIVLWLDETKLPYVMFWGGINKIGFKKEVDAGLFRMMWYGETCANLEELIAHVEGR